MTCQPDLGFGGPGSVTISVCGQPLCPAGAAQLRLNGAKPFATGLLFASLSSTPTPLKGGTLVPIPILLQLPIQVDGSGRIALPVPGGAFGAGSLDVFLQAALVDGALPPRVRARGLSGSVCLASRQIFRSAGSAPLRLGYILGYTVV